MRNVFAWVGSVAVVTMSVTLGWSQSVAPAAVDSVVSACQADGDGCANSVQTYLAGVRSSGVAGEAYNEQVADLAIALIDGYDGTSCNGGELIIASGLAEAARQATSAAQRAQLQDIAASVEQCLPQVRTAALGAPEAASAG